MKHWGTGTSVVEVVVVVEMEVSIHGRQQLIGREGIQERGRERGEYWHSFR